MSDRISAEHNFSLSDSLGGDSRSTRQPSQAQVTNIPSPGMRGGYVTCYVILYRGN